MTSNAARLQPVEDGTPRPHAAFLGALAALVLLALALRLAAAQGALWLDEAWSAQFAREAGTPAGVFFAINHDNNHFLNTLWLQAVGWGAPPLLARALSIASGTAAVALGGWIGLRRSPAAGLATAALLALSPLLLIYGSEARGYAPMLLALLSVIAVADHWLFVRRTAAAPYLIGLCAAVGLLSHLTMLFGLLAVGGWAAATLARRERPLRALLDALQLMRWAIAATLAIAVMLAVVAIGSAGYRIGSVWPFTAAGFVAGLGEMLGYACGWRTAPAWLLIAAALFLSVLAVSWGPQLRERATLYLLAIIALPVTIAVLRLGNSQFPRYFLVSGLIVLLCAGDLFGAAWRRGGAARTVAAAALACFAVASLATDRLLIVDRRGAPEAAIAAMRASQPRGGVVLIDNPRSYAVLASAAASAGYRLEISRALCSWAPLLYVDEDGWAPFPPTLRRCGIPYQLDETRTFSGLSGLSWGLYLRADMLAPLSLRARQSEGTP